MKIKILICTYLLQAGMLLAQQTTAIRLNQIGFFTKGPKIAAIIGSDATTFTVKSTDRTTTYFTGNLSTASTWASSGESVKTADFSNFIQPGNYVVDVAGLGYSYPFTIGNDVLVNVNRMLTKSYYFQRCSASLPQQYAGKWARNAGHLDNSVIIHPSASSPGRPAGTRISSPKGWYDAGDYNLYLTNSGIAVHSLLSAYEHFSSYYDTLKLNIPESGNNLPDILDQVKWNTDWMLTMQDPYDGGVYFKKTDPSFDAYQILPEFDNADRYVCQKTTSSTFNFAAAMAMTARVFNKFDPTYATQCLNAAKTAYAWSIANPTIYFNNPPASNGYPAIITGSYPDTDVSDEKEWAATELYITTKDDSYYSNSYKSSNAYILPNWNLVRYLGLLSLAHHRKNLTAIGFADTTSIKNKIISFATTLSNYQKNNSPYKIVMGQAGNAQFDWGSNGFALRQSAILLMGYFLNGNQDFLKSALSNVDYVLGRNATGYSFVTGIGSKQIMHLHHAMSQGDGVVEPIPGWMAGGPSYVSYVNDGCVNYSNTPATSFIDQFGCYTKVEGDINWNSAAVYATGAMQQYAAFNDAIISSTTDANLDKAIEVFLYPNPMQNILNVVVNGKFSDKCQLQLVNQQGLVILEKTEILRGKNQFSVDLSDVPKGMYVVKLTSEDFKYQTKHVIEGK